MEAILTANSTGTVETATSKAEGRAGKYLTFHLGAEEFGIRVIQVREIIGIQDITGVPQTPSYVKGVINLRGKVTPVICLRQKFGMPEVEYTPRTCIIVVQVKGEAGFVIVGFYEDRWPDHPIDRYFPAFMVTRAQKPPASVLLAGKTVPERNA